MAKNNNSKAKVNHTKVASKQKSKQQSNHLKTQLKEKVATGIVDGVFRFTENLSIADFSQKINKTPAEIVKHFFMQGKIMSQNVMLSEEQMGELCLEYGYDFKKETQVTHANLLDTFEEVLDPAKLKPRPPIVTIMGHVDHGKTTLLDSIRKGHANVVDGEFGGITQHIGAYQVEYSGQVISFIDTPGHEAFSEMRSRGSSVTDIVILVVAADDGIMPQTQEAIDHAKAAKVPIIVFVNKMDKPGANPEKIKSELMAFGLIAEEFGGDTPFVEGSARNSSGIDTLLETILLISELNEYKADPSVYARGVILEAKLDKSRGPIATVLVQSGTLHARDTIVAGGSFGTVRYLEDENRLQIKEALPSKSVVVFGLNKVPRAGDKFMVLANEKLAREVSEAQEARINDEARMKSQQFSLDSIKTQIESGELKTLNLIIKSDTQGTVEAIKGSLQKLVFEKVKINIVRASVGAVSNTDITLASASEAIIYGFNVRPTAQVRTKAEEDGVSIRLHNIIYKVIEEIEELAKGLLDPEYEEITLGEAEIRATFKHTDIGTIAGCRITNGTIPRSAKIHLLRDGVVIFTGELSSLKNKKEDIKEAREGTECGLTIKNFNDIKDGDVLEAFKLEVVKK
ncbi:translation initiation factor IF-2 [Spiroplasma endosymbiont of Othius punctulatus]|uniref:translation initiation factor IF-2 n=1 Tax=Spiroplasma endosymbiont of Othius punctulatus TaxID=3066289 RepID=UPI0030CD7A6B